MPGDLLGPDSVCYCVGCGEDISFDLGLIERFDCHVWGFDPTPRAVEYVAHVAGDHPRYHFASIGVWDQKERLRFFEPANPDHVSHSALNLQGTDRFIVVDVESLAALMEERGHERLDLLKIDVEGAEYRILQHVVDQRLSVGVLLVEYDECFSPLDADWLSRIRDSIAMLADFGFELVAVRGRGNLTFVQRNR